MYITIDPYYNTQFYHECCSALKNNGVSYKLFISVRPPYNWYIKVEDSNSPKFINFDVLGKSEQKYLVSCTQPLNVQDTVPLYRRNMGNWKDIYFMCDAYTDCLDKDCYVFKLDNRDQAVEISKTMKIYFLGKYKKFKLFMCNNKHIQNLVPLEHILYHSENTTVKDLQDMEIKINYNVLLHSGIETKLQKYIRMPYFEDGQFVMTITPFIDKSLFKFLQKRNSNRTYGVKEIEKIVLYFLFELYYNTLMNIRSLDGEFDEDHD